MLTWLWLSIHPDIAMSFALIGAVYALNVGAVAFVLLVRAAWLAGTGS